MIHENQKQLDKCPEKRMGSDVEITVTPEQKKIMEAAIVFADFLTTRWPQVDQGGEPDKEQREREPKINYYFSGSLATMLLAKAHSFTELDPNRVPAIVEMRTRELSPWSRRILASFARPIGDLDYVPTTHWQEQQQQLHGLYGKVSDEEYQLTRKKFLLKGGGGPSFDEVPEAGQAVLKRNEKDIKIMCDPVVTYGEQKIVKVRIADRDYYVASPDSSLAYKVLHLLQSYHQKPEKFNIDFAKLIHATREIYTEKEIEAAIGQALSGYEKAMEASHERHQKDERSPQAYEKEIPKMIRKVLANPSVSPEIKTILEKL